MGRSLKARQAELVGLQGVGGSIDADRPACWMFFPRQSTLGHDVHPSECRTRSHVLSAWGQKDYPVRQVRAFGAEMARKVKIAGEAGLKALIERYACPVPYHVVRTRLLGSIATPELPVSPVQVLQDLWGGELPVFESIDEADELIGALINGLWNDLARHQKRSQPFRLTRMPMEPTVENLGRYSRTRREELDGFMEGIFKGATRSICPSAQMRLSFILPTCAP